MSDQATNPADDLNTKPPKGVGISPKLFFAVIVGIAVVLLFVLILIFSYRGHAHTAKSTNLQTLVQQQTGLSAETAIHQLNQIEQGGVLVDEKSPEKKENATSPSSAMPPTSNHADNTDFAGIAPPQDLQVQQAARSQISVMNNFQGPTHQPVLNKPENVDNVSAQPTSLSSQINQLNQMAGQALGNVNGMGPGTSGSEQNQQSQKIAFLNAQKKSDSQFYLNSKLTAPVSPYEVKAGTLIPATLLTGINSDLPGQITAQVSQNVYDTVTGNFLLIPQGTRVLGMYDSKVAYGQSRVLIAWSRLIFPNGDSFNLQGQPGVDLMGMAGLHDLVNNHYTRIFGSALAFSIFGALGQLSQPKQVNNTTPSNAQIIYGAIGQNLTQAGVQLMEKNMNIQPTLTIRPGSNFNILLTRDMVLPGPYTRMAAATPTSPQYTQSLK